MEHFSVIRNTEGCVGSSLSSKPPGTSKQKNLSDMERDIENIVRESIRVLKKDPREYHPFYLTVDKLVKSDQAKAFFTSESVSDAFWSKWDKLAKTMFEDEKYSTDNVTTATSAYGTYILSNKIVPDNVIMFSKPLKNGERVFQNLEKIARNIVTERGQECKQDFLQMRLKLLKHCECITHPKDVVEMNEVWSKFMMWAGEAKAQGNYREESTAVSFVVEQAGGESEREGRKRRQLEGMKAPEELEAYRKKRAEQERRRRAAMTEEQKKICLKREAEKRIRQRRAKMREERKKAGSGAKASGGQREENLTEEELVKREHARKLRSERDRRNRRRLKESMTEEKKQENKMKIIISRLSKQATMTDEERKERRMKEYLYRQARIARMDKEELEAYKKKGYNRMRRWRESLTGEKKERLKKSMAESMKRYLEKLKREGQTLGYNYPKKNSEKRLEYHRTKVANETPEQREKRLMRYKVYQAKRKLKKQLEEEGSLSSKEIEMRLEELEREIRSKPYQSTGKSYEPRPQARKPHGKVVRNKYSKSTDKSWCEGESVQQNTTQAPNVPIVMHPEPSSSVAHLGTAPLETETTNWNHETVGSVVHSDEMDEDDFYDNAAFLTCSPSPSSTPKHETEEKCTPSSVEQNVGSLHEMSEESPTPFAYAHVTRKEQLEQEIQLKIPQQTSLDMFKGPDESVRPTNFHESKCPNCSKTFEDEILLRKHIKTSHPHKCWMCPKCKEVMLSPADFAEHFKTSHARKPASNPFVSSTDEKSRQSTEQSKPVSNIQFICIRCLNEFQKWDQLAKHVKLKHPQSYWPCPHCRLIKYSERSLLFHSKLCSTFRTKIVVK